MPLVEALEALGVRYYIGGSVAGSAHGVGRSTMDIDVIADLRPRHVHSLVQRLASEFYIDAEMIKGGVLRIQQGALDASYLQRRAAEIGVADLLDRALIEAQAP